MLIKTDSGFALSQEIIKAADAFLALSDAESMFVVVASGFSITFWRDGITKELRANCLLSKRALEMLAIAEDLEDALPEVAEGDR